MKCTCGIENVAGSRFCNGCGSKLEPAGKSCPRAGCGRTGLPAEALYCPDCGSELAEERTLSLSQAEPEKAEQCVETINGVTFKMVLVNGGEFMMGSEGECDNEKPMHRVRVSDFYIGKNPVTQQQWLAVMGCNPSKYNDQARPVESVSWSDAQEFILELKKKSERKYRLPTEAEWEYAARGGSKSEGFVYAGSNNLDWVGWYEQNSGGSWLKTGKTQRVGQKKANELGLHDMSGNVWEWCSDWYGGNYYDECQARGVADNPQGPSSGSLRVIRGGSWNNYAGRCRSAYRYGGTPDGRDGNVGFRLVFVP